MLASLAQPCDITLGFDCVHYRYRRGLPAHEVRSVLAPSASGATLDKLRTRSGARDVNAINNSVQAAVAKASVGATLKVRLEAVDGRQCGRRDECG